MGLGILGEELDVVGTVPGFLERKKRFTALAQNGSLKFDRSGKDPILLVPQPSDDPRDPLNFPRWRRDLHLLVLCLTGILAVCLSSIIAPISLLLLEGFPGILTEDIGNGTAYHLLAIGLGGFFWVGSARIWGKRHAFLFGTVFIIVGCIWAGFATTWSSFLGARALQGIGVAPFEGLINAAVVDLFFVHERGWRMSLTNMSLYGAGFCCPVISGIVAERLGWEWIFWLVAAITGALLPLMFLFCFETAWIRPARAEAPMDLNIAQETLITSAAVEDEKSLQQAILVPSPFSDSSAEPLKHFESTSARSPPSSNASGEASDDSRSEWSYINTLRIFNGRKNNLNFFKILIRPLPLFVDPGVLWACLTQAVMISWTIFIAVALSVLYIFPPLSYGPAQLGYLYAGAGIGSVAAFVISGVVQDPLAQFLTKRNGGVFEPEFRIPVVAALQLVTGVIGLFGFGIVGEDLPRWRWLLPDIFFCFQVASMVFGAVASAMYISDAYSRVAVECFTCLLIFKNIFTFGIVTGAIKWLIFHGTFKVLSIMGGIQIFIGLLSVPMYIFGKRNRQLHARVNIMERLKLN